MSDSAEVLSCSGLRHTFTDAGSELEVLQGIDFAVGRGELVAIVGASGTGKSTLLHLLGGLDQPTRGEVLIENQPMHALSDAQRGDLRNRALGFVYQFHHLLPEFTALENVALPLLVRRAPVAEATQRARALLERVGLADRLEHTPPQLSGGERQRCAVARALVTRPSLILADEPTGNLDSETGERLFELMLELNRDFNTSLVVVTHDPALAARLDSRYRISSGHLTREV